MSTDRDSQTGIASMGLALPSLAMSLDELATLRDVDPAKFRDGLGCKSMALCADGENPVMLGVTAARRALAAWGGDIADIGLIAVGTETARDMSRPLSAWIAAELELAGDIRSYEVKHACYGGTLALRQALEWRWAGAAQGRAALVICTDVALYEPEHPGEATQGAAAFAMVVDKPDLLRVANRSYAFSRPAFDFWRPVGDSFPKVDGPLSLQCYKEAVQSTFAAWNSDSDAWFGFEDCEAFAFHAPFPKMVKKGFVHGAESLGTSAERAVQLYETRVEPSLQWNREVGNCYTASTWLSLASALATTDARRLAAFSYGSGCGAELLLFEKAEDADISGVVKAYEDYTANRTLITGDEYSAMRERKAGAHFQVAD